MIILINKIIFKRRKLRKGEIPKVEFPFKNIFDENGKKINIILISAPFRTKEHEDLYKEYLEAGLDFCGISSYQEFPNKIANPYEDRFHEERNHDYPSMVKCWLHCFKDEKYIKKFKHLPHMLLTEADLKDTDYYKPENLKKEYDFIYVCLKDNDKCIDSWQAYNRNWELAKKCIEIMCSKFRLKGLLVGRINCDIPESCKGLLTLTDFLSFYVFQSYLKKSKFIFIPNISDASPRVITEALSYNVPAIVNWNIFGGWHNIKPGVSGEFFTDENNLIHALEKLLNNYDNYKPREWFINTSGKNIKGKELAEFLLEYYPNINNKQIKLATISI